MILRNVGTYVSNYTASYVRRRKSSGKGHFSTACTNNQSASDNEPAKLGTISISNSSRVSEVHGDHTLAPSGHATKLTWLQSAHYTCFIWLAIRNTAHHTHFSSVGICAYGQLGIHAVTMIRPVSPFVLFCKIIITGSFVSVYSTLHYCKYRLPQRNLKRYAVKERYLYLARDIHHLRSSSVKI